MPQTHRLFFSIAIGCLTLLTLNAQDLRVAGVAGPIIWMSARQGEGATTSVNIRGISNEIQQSLQAGLLNFHPTFKVPELSIKGSSLDLNTATVFCVVHPQMSDEETIWQFEKNGQPTVLATSHRVADLSNFQFINLLKRSRAKPYFANYFQHLNTLDSSASYSFVLGPGPRDIPINRLRSGVAEVIVFDRVISPKAKSVIDSYLSIQYGIPLPQVVPTNYYDSDYTVIWDAKKNRSYPSEVVALGRSKSTNLNQKQTQSEVLVFSAGQRALSNAINPAHLPDNSYLFWSHDGKSLAWQQNLNHGVKSLERTWLAVVHDSMRTISTQIHLREDHLQVSKSPEEIWWLDRYPDRRDMTLAQLDAIPFRSDVTGDLSIDSLKWDQDRSGHDLFTISAGPVFRVNSQIIESHCNEDSGAVSIKIFGGVAPYSIKLTQRDGPQLHTVVSEETFLEFEDLRAGVFMLEVTDQTTHTFRKVIPINHLDALPITLPNQFILDEKEMTLDPSKYFEVPVGADVAWILPNQDQMKLPVLKTTLPGIHTLVIQENGCRSTQSFEIVKSTGEIIEHVALFPNPVAVGSAMKAQIKLHLPSPVDIELVSASGQQIRRWRLGGKKEYWVEQNMPLSGNYFLNVRSLQKNKSTPFVVQ